jgi:hypothetical protein
MPHPHTLLLRIQVYRAGATRRCYHSPDHSIEQGDIVLQLHLTGATKGYCFVCAQEMLNLASAQLDFLSTQLLAPAEEQGEYEKRFKAWKKSQ